MSGTDLGTAQCGMILGMTHGTALGMTRTGADLHHTAHTIRITDQHPDQDLIQVQAMVQDAIQAEATQAVTPVAHKVVTQAVAGAEAIQAEEVTLAEEEAILEAEVTLEPAETIPVAIQQAPLVPAVRHGL